MKYAVRQAAQKGNVSELEHLHRKTPGCLAERDPSGCVAAHVAAELGHLNVIKYVCKVAPDTITLMDNDGFSPLKYCLLAREHGEGCKKVVRFIFALKPECLNTPDHVGRTPIFSAAMRGLDYVVRLIYSRVGPAGLEHVDNNGLKAIHFAALEGQIEVIKVLMELRAHTNPEENTAGLTPLSVANLHGNYVARDLIMRWDKMSEEERFVIHEYGWCYYDLPRWTLHGHDEFPAHLRRKAFAVVVCMPALAPVYTLVVQAIDAIKRALQF